MKNINKFLAIALTGLVAAGCNDLDTYPMGGTVTTEQKEAVLKNDPTMAEASTQALVQGLKLVMANYDVHTDFGVPSLFLITDSRCQDLHSPNSGYNWYSAAANMDDFAGNYYDNLLFWKTFYNEIFSANLVVGSIDKATEDPKLQYYLAQSLTFRAYAYYNLAQMYQFTYIKDPSAPTVPVVTAENADSVAMIGGAPRATCEELYAQILSDLNTALAMMENAENNGIRRPDKTFVNTAVIRGLRARAYLTMNRWSEAAADAQEAINLANNEGLSPYSIQQASVPAFYDMNDNNMMWAIHNTSAESFTQGVVNFASMMGSWMSNGYCSVGTYRQINTKLYNWIPETDIRKGWWLGADAAPTPNLPASYREYIETAEGGRVFIPYTQVKFGAANNAPGQPDGATDVPLMRIEEMYLILAEAQGMTSPATGASTLAQFISTYRNPSYTFSGSDAQAVQDEIWMQRRVELWGEGFSYYDMMRLQKGIDRRGGGYPAEWVYVVQPNDPVLLYVIAQPEQIANKNLGNCDNGASVPSPVPDEN